MAAVVFFLSAFREEDVLLTLVVRGVGRLLLDCQLNGWNVETCQPSFSIWCWLHDRLSGVQHALGLVIEEHLPIISDSVVLLYSVYLLGSFGLHALLADVLGVVLVIVIVERGLHLYHACHRRLEV